MYLYHYKYADWIEVFKEQFHFISRKDSQVAISCVRSVAYLHQFRISVFLE